jgi:hypothetical protein
MSLKIDCSSLVSDKTGRNSESIVHVVRTTVLRNGGATRPLRQGPRRTARSVDRSRVEPRPKPGFARQEGKYRNSTRSLRVLCCISIRLSYANLIGIREMSERANDQLADLIGSDCNGHMQAGIASVTPDLCHIRLGWRSQRPLWALAYKHFKKCF